jgi:penicillin V acylase-like amidase (Ntn superfamily)
MVKQTAKKSIHVLPAAAPINRFVRASTDEARYASINAMQIISLNNVIFIVSTFGVPYKNTSFAARTAFG